MKKGLLCDIEGVIFKEEKPIPGASETLAELRRRGVPVLFVSNITRHPRQEIVESLRSMGIGIDPGELITPPVAASAYIQKKNYRDVAAFVDKSLLPDLGIDQLPAKGKEFADCVVMGDIGRKMDFDCMDQIFTLVTNGADLVALHKDHFSRGAKRLVIDLGAFVAGIEYATGKTARIMGKPSADFFHLALSKLGCRAEEALMVGDDLDSDIMGGNDANMTTVLVLTGKTPSVPEDVEENKKPDHIISDISQLLELPFHFCSS